MDEKPLDLSKNSICSTSEGETISSENHQNSVEDQITPTQSVIAQEQELSNSEERIISISHERIDSVPNTESNDKSESWVTEDPPGVGRKRKSSGASEVASKGEGRRSIESSSVMGIKDVSRVHANPECHDRAAADSGPSTSASGHESIDIQSPLRTQKQSLTSGYCGKCNSNHANYLRHVRVHTDEKPYTCGECGQVFARTDYLQRHMRIHTGEQPYRCQVCNRRFSDSSNLRQHRRTHTGEQPYRCQVCNRTFSASSSLIRHRRIHTGEQPYCCQVCNRTFSDPSSLIRHRRTHSREQPFVCPICGRHFSVRSSMQRHKRSHTK